MLQLCMNTLTDHYRSLTVFIHKRKGPVNDIRAQAAGGICATCGVQAHPVRTLMTSTVHLTQPPTLPLVDQTVY